jgi:alkanesulfonate monooxygenase SsuD/methylene tetrahydromethanopterin reductase-like flavin-dependent oxidoreductase (luciferase family)
VLSEGRYELGVGRGYRKNEFDAFCLPMSEAQERYEENLSLLMKCLTSKERFSWHSKHWNFENIVVEPGVVQNPHPPMWMAAGTPGGIAYVASKGYGALMDQIASVDEIIERVRIFLDAQEKAGLKRDAMRCGVTRALHIINSEEERRQAFARRRETLKNIGELAKKPGGFNPASMDDSDIASDDAALIGTPSEIVERLQRLADGGVEYVLLTNATASRESLMTFADKIMPHIKQPAQVAAKAA